MARRRQNTTADDLIELISLLPWWAGVSFALVSYVILHLLATPAVATAAQPDQIGGGITSSIWKAFAHVGQFLLPFLCLLGALVSVLRRNKRRALLENITRQPGVSALEGISWHDFEMLVGEAYRQQGYRVVEGKGNGADGGVDLRLQKGGDRFLVQCKQWRSFKVGVQVVRELYGVMAAEGAAGGMVVTSGRFTDEARAFAAGRNVQLVDGAALKLLLDRARGTSAAAQPAPKPNIEAAPRSFSTPPDCPVCSAAMTRRTAKRGANAGNSFWGCTKYPSCKGTLS